MSIIPPTDDNIELAATLILEGKLIGIPTETVYGIAANAMNASAVIQIFQVKGRPGENPLIVHVATIEQARRITKDFSKEAEQLATRFWPGPLTLVLPKAHDVPDVVTAGLGTVAVRMPNHSVALSLIERAGTPISAPSANQFMSLSPTSALMIDPAIARQLSLILDGGACQIGIESTVLDLASSEPRILRPGAISQEQIESALGKNLSGDLTAERKSPGMYPKHYAPRSPVKFVDKLSPGQAGLTFEEQNGPNQITMSAEPTEYARALYQCLFDMDRMRIGTIFIQSPPQTKEWNAVWDRLTKAAGS